MTKDELRKMFNEVAAEVYSPESKAKITEQIKRDDHGIDGLSLAIATNREQDKTFLLRVLEKALCNK